MIRLTQNGLYPFYQWSRFVSFLYSRGFLPPLWLLAAKKTSFQRGSKKTQFLAENPLCFVNTLMEMLSFFFVKFETKLQSIFFFALKMNPFPDSLLIWTWLCFFYPTFSFFFGKRKIWCKSNKSFLVRHLKRLVLTLELEFSSPQGCFYYWIIYQILKRNLSFVSFK